MTGAVLRCEEAYSRHSFTGAHETAYFAEGGVLPNLYAPDFRR